MRIRDWTRTKIQTQAETEPETETETKTETQTDRQTDKQTDRADLTIRIDRQTVANLQGPAPPHDFL